MIFSDMGTVFQFLLKNRIVETKTTTKRRSKPGEAEVAHILNSWGIDELEGFEEFLNSQGFSLYEATDQDYKGIALGGKMWMLIRRPQYDISSFLSIDPTVEAIRIKDTESKEVLGVWFLHIWLMYLYLTYTRIGRSPEQVSKYEDTFFIADDLIDAVREHLERVRSLQLESEAQKRLVDILDSEKGTDVNRRVKGFTDVMAKSNLIQKVSENEYQQTLIGAIEIAEAFRSVMLGTLVKEDSVIQNLDQLAVG